MSTPICIFEDEKYRNFLPLTYVRPVYDLRCGVLTIREKIQKYYNTDNIILHSRKYLEHFLIENNKEIPVNKFNTGKILFINGRLLPSFDFVDKVQTDGRDQIFISEGNVVAARLSTELIKDLLKNNTELISTFVKLDCDVTKIDANLLGYPWHIIQKNGEEIEKDISLIKPSKPSVKFNGVHFINDDNIFIEDNVLIKPNVTLDASAGPIFIQNGTKILSNTYIAGPVFIGRKSFVKANTQIYQDTSIGPVCKVGGEIENSIIHSYSNKQHDGFLGHAYLGQWVNIGASSNNSDLRNDYGKIKVLIDGEEVNTESQFFGLVMGDHSKCAINTMFNTGTIVGISSNIYGSGFPPIVIPSFSWGGSESIREYHLRKAIEVAKTVKSRRNINMATADLEVFKKVFELTQEERDKYINKEKG